MSRVTDEELVEQARAGDEDAAIAIYERYKVDIYDYLRRNSRFTAADPDDLFQGVWQQVFKDIDTFDPERGRLRAWLYGIARNQLRPTWRAAKRRREDAVEDISVHADRQLSSPEQAVARQQVLAHLEACIDALPEDKREIVLQRMMGLSHQEIAALLELSSANSRARYSRALKLLAECLERKGVRHE